MDLNLDRFDSSFLELDEEDLSEIHRMVDEWELNFGALEVSFSSQLIITFISKQSNHFYCRALMERNWWDLFK
jgi:hypothetical protein